MLARNALISPSTIARVKESADITDIVSDHVVLKKTGKDLSGFCPFHDNKRTPSFTVIPSKNFYHCFSCNESGDPIKFLMKIGQDSFTEAVLGIANRYSIPVEYQESPPAARHQATRRELLLAASADASRYYQDCLYQEGGVKALSYLREERSLSADTIQQFSLGASPQGWTHLMDHLKAKGHSEDSIEGAGLIIRRKDGQGFYDRFRGRLMIPICDSLGRPIGFGARSISGEMPKYINSPDTDLFEKGQTLFGLHLAKAAINKEDCAIVVEGYFDVIALHSHGIANAVASQGTALGSHQIRQLLRHTESNRLVLNFDGDAAGVNAAERAIGEVESLAQQGLVDLRILSLAGHKDADEYVASQGPHAYLTAVRRTSPWIEWQLDRLVNGLDTSDGSAFRTATTAISNRLSGINDRATQSLYCHRYAEKLALGNVRLAIQLEADLRRGLRKIASPPVVVSVPLDRADPRDAAELQLLKIYLHCPNQRPNLDRMFQDSGFSFQGQINHQLWKLFGVAAFHHPGSDWGLIISSYLVDLEPEVIAIANTVINLTEIAKINTCNNPAIVAQGALASISKIEAKQRQTKNLARLLEQPIATVEECVELAIERGGENPIEDARRQLNAVAYQYQDLAAQERLLMRELDDRRRSGFIF
jgi:DNA primase